MKVFRAPEEIPPDLGPSVVTIGNFDGVHLGHRQLTDGMYRDGFYCPLAEMLMGETAENLAQIYGISRDEQDEYAIESQQRAATQARSVSQ